MRPPIQTRGLYSGRQYNGRPGFSGSPAGPGSRSGYLRAERCALQHSPEMTSYLAFRRSPMGPAQNCCRGLRARTETSTYPGRCVCAPTPAPILRPQDHCKSAQVWVGARKWAALTAPKLNQGCLTQSTAPPKPPEGPTSGTCHRIAGLARGGGPADMAVCGGCVDTGQKSPTDTGGRGTRTPNPPAPEQYAHGRWNARNGFISNCQRLGAKRASHRSTHAAVWCVGTESRLPLHLLIV